MGSMRVIPPRMSVFRNGRAKMTQPEMNKRETLLYIKQMLGQLTKMAKETDNPLLAYMIEMAREEASDRLEENSPGADEIPMSNRASR